MNSCQWHCKTDSGLLLEDLKIGCFSVFFLVSGNFIDVYAAGGGLEGPSSVR